MSENQEMTVHEVAAKFGKSVWAVYRWVQRKWLRARKHANVWVIDRADADRFAPPKRGPRFKRDRRKA